MLGTIVNAGAVVLGGGLGLLLKKGLPARISEAIMGGVGLVVLYIGVSGALAGENVLVAVLSVVLGGALGARCRAVVFNRLIPWRIKEGLLQWLAPVRVVDSDIWALDLMAIGVDIDKVALIRHGLKQAQKPHVLLRHLPKLLL